MKIGKRERIDLSEVRQLCSDADGNPVNIEIRPMPVTFGQKITERLPDPVPPIAIARDAKGKVIRYDLPREPQLHGKPAMMYVTEDPEHKKRVLQTNMRQAMLAFYEISRSASNEEHRIQWDAVPPHDECTDAMEWEVFADALMSEVQSFGLPMAAILSTCNRVAEISGADPRQIQELASTFS